MYFLAAESDQMDQMKINMKFCVVLLWCMCVLSGCVSARPSAPLSSPEDQLQMVQKVVGGMSGREVSNADMKRVVRDVQQNPNSRAAVNKILGAGDPVVVKYSPVTGKHYSGNLDVDPETGVKLEVLSE